MSYGGPAVGSTAASGPATIRQVKLEKECEFRVEVSPDAPLRLRLLTGSAEIYGTEIPPEIWLTFPPRLKFAVHTHILIIFLRIHMYFVLFSVVKVKESQIVNIDIL